MLFFILHIFLLEDEIVSVPQYAENLTYINAVVTYEISLHGGLWVFAWGTWTGEHEALSII